MKNILIVGCGFSGSVIARELADNTNLSITIIDEREHIGGNCYTERDKDSNIMIHKYGPHIFNTNREDVWKYVSNFSIIQPYINRVKALTKSGVYSMPINLHTINQLFSRTYNPKEAREFIDNLADKSINEPKNFEEQALRYLGREIYDTFFYGYTKKQWGCEPKLLPASILKRLPVRFNYDDNYYSTKYQGIPLDGYTNIFERLLSHPQIKIQLNTKFCNSLISEYDYVIYTGAIDNFFEYVEGRLGYRTVTFERIDAIGDFQGVAVMNYTGQEIPYTRIHEHKHFTPWESHDKTVCFKEFSIETGELDSPYYPKCLEEDMILMKKYYLLAQQQNKVSFIGRLATYRYLNMDQAIAEALDFSKEIITSIKNKTSIPVFSSIIKF